MLALLIPDPTYPGKDFDVFMQPLVQKLAKTMEGCLYSVCVAT
jgi:hypothetical protein